MPGLGTHGAFGAAAVSALCMLRPACLKSVLIPSFFHVCSNFLMSIRMKRLKRLEGTGKRFLSVSWGSCPGGWVQVHWHTTLAWSAQLCWANALEGAWSLELPCGREGSRRSKTSLKMLGLNNRVSWAAWSHPLRLPEPSSLLPAMVLSVSSPELHCFVGGSERTRETALPQHLCYPVLLWLLPADLES